MHLWRNTLSKIYLLVLFTGIYSCIKTTPRTDVPISITTGMYLDIFQKEIEYKANIDINSMASVIFFIKNQDSILSSIGGEFDWFILQNINNEISSSTFPKINQYLLELSQGSQHKYEDCSILFNSSVAMTDEVCECMFLFIYTNKLNENHSVRNIVNLILSYRVYKGL